MGNFSQEQGDYGKIWNSRIKLDQIYDLNIKRKRNEWIWTFSWPKFWIEICSPEQQQQQTQIANKPTAEELKSVVLKKIDPNSLPQSNANDDIRSNLLAAIRHGIKLKRVAEEKKREVEQNGPLHDVASILARRVALELSDSDGVDGGDDDENESDPWDDESEC